MARKYAAELLGTALLVFFGAGMAALVFGFRIFGASLAAGLIAVALAFGLIYAGLVYVIGPISGGHINPAVTLGAYLSNRITLVELGAYWVAQLIGSIFGALVLWWCLSTSPFYSKSRIGLGANGYGANSLLHVGAGGAFLIEIVLTGMFVLVVLCLSHEGATLAVAGTGIGISLAVANLIGIPFDGASVNPARSFGPAIVAGGPVLSQLWLFLIAPLVGAILATGVYLLLYPTPGGLPGAVNHALGRHLLVTAGDRFEPSAQPGEMGSGAGRAATRVPGADPAAPQSPSGPPAPSGPPPDAGGTGWRRWTARRRFLAARMA
jgi:aquaporin Z